MQLARAKFMSNGNCGYVLKPQVMREGEVTKLTYFEQAFLLISLPRV